jgi:threonine dehydrogenase-like Zn-dependent dehydrogenase
MSLIKIQLGEEVRLMSTPTLRRAARISNHGNIEVAEVPLTKPGAGEMLIRVACSLISPGTELNALRNRPAEGYSGEESWREFGYQNAGVVEDANGCDGFANGDRVACLGGVYAPHSEWGIAPQNLVWKLPDAVSFEEGAFTNLLGTALWAVRRSQIQFGSYVAVVGLGIVGQLISQLATLSGAHAIGIDRVAMRQQKALELGAEFVAQFDSETLADWKQKYTRGYGIDAGYIAFGGDASAVAEHLARAMKTAPDTHGYGRIVVVGGAKVTANLPAIFGNIDICSSSRTGPGYHDKSWERGADYPAAIVPWSTRRNVEECFLAIERKKLRIEPLITHRVSLDEVPAACRQLIEHPDEALGVIVRYEA